MKKLQVVIEDKPDSVSNFEAIMKTQFICWDAGSGNYDIAKYNHNVEWHNDSDVFRGTYAECLREKESKEIEVYRYNNCLPHLSNC